MKNHFLLIFHVKWYFAPGAQKSAPQPWLLGAKKYFLNIFKNVYTIQNLFLESPDIIECVYEFHVWIYHLVLEKAPLTCKKHHFLEKHEILSAFFDKYQGAFSNTSYLHRM